MFPVDEESTRHEHEELKATCSALVLRPSSLSDQNGVLPIDQWASPRRLASFLRDTVEKNVPIADVAMKPSSIIRCLMRCDGLWEE